MKAIVVKINDKPVVVSQLCDLTTKQFLDLKKEAEKTYKEKDNHIANLENTISQAHLHIEELTRKINYLGKQIAIDRGEIEEDDKNEYELVIKEPEQHEELVEEPIPENETDDVVEESEEQE